MVNYEKAKDRIYTDVYLNHFADKWSNCFMATIRATNGSLNVIPITDRLGRVHESRWVGGWVGGWAAHMIIP